MKRVNVIARRKKKYVNKKCESKIVLLIVKFRYRNGNNT